jgi:hypothetical protein
VTVAAPVVVAEKPTKQILPELPKGTSGHGEGVNIPVTPATERVTVPVGADAPAATASLTAAMQLWDWPTAMTIG